MSFSIARESELKLEPPEFLCDRVISDKTLDPLPKTAFFGLISGPAGSGKTTLMINMLTRRDMYKKAYDNVFLIMPSHSLASIKDRSFRQHMERSPEHYFEDLDFDTLEHVRMMTQDAAEDGQNSILVMDDVTASLKNREIQTLLKKLIWNRRHLRLSVIILAQAYIALPPSIRKSISHCWMYKPVNKREIVNVFDELMFLDRKTADALLRFVYRGPHDLLYAITATQTFHRNFDEIRIGECDASVGGVV
jgi:thymidine kinase